MKERFSFDAKVIESFEKNKDSRFHTSAKNNKATFWFYLLLFNCFPYFFFFLRVKTKGLDSLIVNIAFHSFGKTRLFKS